MEEKQASIPYYAHEGEMTRMDRINRRLWILVLVLTLALIGTNAGWIIYEAQYTDQEYSYEIQQETGGEGTNTYTGNTINIGGEINGEADDPSHGPTESESR